MQTLICLLLLCGMVVPSKAAGNPNVVFIISDDQAWTDYGFMGHPEVETPHLDKLSRQSLTFTHGYVPTSLCCPSLAALLTGKFPHETKVTGNEPPRPRDANGKPSSQAYQDPGFLEQVATLNGFITAHPRLPAELAKAGYLSFQSGKWWAGNFSSGGFTHGMSHGSAAKGGRHGDVGLEIGRKTLQPIFDFLAEAQRQQRPFFLWYAPMLPHQPHDPPPRLLEKYQKRTPSLPVAKYWAMCELFDETCGQLLTHLEQQNLADHTLVVFLSDNGWIQDPERPRFRADSKLSQYDGGLRTPILIRWPGRVTPEINATPVSSVDLAPTIYRAAGLAVPAGLSGINLLDAAAVRRRSPVFGECFLHNAVDIQNPAANLTYRWCVAGDWKLILPNAANIAAPNKPGRSIGPELYDLARDPLEDKNLADEKPEKVRELTGRIDAWWKPQ
ncbi:MAG: sulfatase-like hydrolase/transferase [Verrucomicrobiales bacterium]|nr:sulfatase-like hydrolase/transferase [Verrucomicrobiales bacterium]